jgi:hypothetical protein
MQPRTASMKASRSTPARDGAEVDRLTLIRQRAEVRSGLSRADAALEPEA